ncbi:uncharacterized protein LOC100908871 [Galendromus occidentalis]|uniref:Uncharacterized protein LOC100908871 n=1 Tax=Galendromus occidentalis TaxID=34638 RepID=A0AAJ7SDU7_9ACAR|nr:uncharacterized protein LOC100908871 [Galendromus occidentalis]
MMQQVLVKRRMTTAAILRTARLPIAHPDRMSPPKMSDPTEMSRTSVCRMRMSKMHGNPGRIAQKGTTRTAIDPVRRSATMGTKQTTSPALKTGMPRTRPRRLRKHPSGGLLRNAS